MVITGLTYNLKFPEQTGPHPWPTRRPLVAAQLREAGAQVVGTQEGHHEQLREIARDAGYEMVGTGREGGVRGEFCAVLYDPAVLTPLEHGNFWLSDTPEVPGSVGRGWGNHVIRMATWVRFQIAGGPRLNWLNTHLDNKAARARQRGAALIVERLDRFAAEEPLVVSGDFNCAPDSPPYRTLVAAGLTDAWRAAGTPEHGTYGGWRAPRPADDRIDWLLTRGPVAVRSAGIGVLHDGDRWPSDHVPVRVELDLGDAVNGSASSTDPGA
ncbi:MAG: endonuclease/exonuclease/phosphatase family protein [Actinocatenispora sp.]